MMRSRSSTLRLAGALAVIIGVGTMSWFWNRHRTAAWNPSSLQPPWRGGESIYAFISKHVRPGTKGLADGAETLPDEKPAEGIRWVAGGMDGVFGHHMGDGQPRQRAARVHQLLWKAVTDGSAAKVKDLYEALLEGRALEYIDPLIDELSRDSRIDRDRLD